jgi:hypothetical protein
MSYQDKETSKPNFGEMLLIILFSLALVMIFFGCMTPQKAVNYLKKKELLADTCAANFSVDSSRTDSAEFNKSKSDFDSVAAELEEKIKMAASENESLYEWINRLMADSTLDCDSLSDAIYKYAAREKNKTSELQLQIEALRSAAKNIKPKIEYLRDRAYETVLNENNVTLERKLGQSETKAQALEEMNASLTKVIKAKNKKIFWLYLIIAALVAWNFRRPIGKLINPIKTIIPI